MDILLSVLFKLATVLIFLGLASLSVYWGLLRKLQPRWAILLGAMMVLVYIGFPFLTDLITSKTDTWVELQQAFDQVCQEKAKAMAADKMSQADIDSIMGLLKKYFLFCFPAWVLVGALFTGFLSYYLVSTVASKITPRIDMPVPFWQWAVPEPLIFGLILSGGLKLLPNLSPMMDIVTDNLLILFLAVYTFAGLTITSFYFKKWRFSLLLRLLAYLLLFELTFNAVCILGVLDIWLDFRKIKKPSTESTT